jgi:hypothetical protein
MTAATELRDRLTTGTVLTCISNTFRPERNGSTKTVMSMKDGRALCLETEGDIPSIVHLPIEDAGIEQLDENTYRWPMCLFTQSGSHTITYRIEAA